MGFGQMEVRQVVNLGGRWYLLLGSGTGTRGARWRDPRAIEVLPDGALRVR